jgi:uncharacterized membrane protein YcaP (DUF421 family)
MAARITAPVVHIHHTSRRGRFNMHQNSSGPYDWKRIVLGDAPPQFLVEVFFRSILMYVVLLVALRLLGKRMNAQLSIMEFAVMISLGAIVSLPMQSPERGVLNGAVLLILILTFQRGLAFLSFKSRKVDRIMNGNMSTLVKDGILQTEIMRKEGITKDQLFAQLRHKGVNQLGELDRVYLEAHGVFSVFHARSPKPGLSTLPEKDDAYLDTLPRRDGMCACCYCGAAEKTKGMESDECPNCHCRRWTQAII